MNGKRVKQLRKYLLSQTEEERVVLYTAFLGVKKLKKGCVRDRMLNFKQLKRLYTRN